MTPTTWTPEEDRIALRLRDAGKTLGQIASVLDRSERSVAYRLLKLADQLAKLKNKPKLRPCLCCGKKFTSAGPHNRLCLDCRRKDVSPYAPF